MSENLQRRLILVSNRLPFQLLGEQNQIVLKESDGGLVSALKSYFESGQGPTFSSSRWIGAADFPEKRWKKYIAKQKDSLPSTFDVEPIFIETKTYNRFYNGFCNATLWPLFHYFPSYVEYDEATFKSYQEVNRFFAERILALLQPGDILWIHDYQLMLLPGMIREQRPDATIGFFLHIPFPSFEIFRLLHRPWKEKIVGGLLGADLIGFHTYEYVQHFLKTVQMVCGFDHQFRTIFTSNRLVKADMFPLGIDFKKFHNAGQRADVMEQKESIQKNFAGKKIIFSVDRLDYTKGVTHRLAGFERFLELHPEWLEQVIFIQVVVPSRQIVSKYNERRKLIEEQIGSINGKYSTLQWQPLIYRYSNLSFPELCALYQVADVALVTPLRDGMNLVAKEYVASQHDQGVMILSELAGASSEMGEALMVNPMDKGEVASAIFTALTMPAAEQRQKLEILQRRLIDYDVVHWVKDFLKQLDETKEQQVSQQTSLVTSRVAANIVCEFARATKRHLFLDYDGTLVPFARYPRYATPNSELLGLLDSLASDPRTDITIISGRDRTTLEEWFHGLAVNIVAEHGVAFRSKDGKWKFETEIDQSWKPWVRPTLELFTQRSPGSFIEEKNHTLAWHYRNANTEMGFTRSRELLDNLHHLVRNTQLQIMDGNKVIEVRVSGVDKGVIAKKILEEDHYDFVLAIGDDKTDEDMFKALTGRAITIKIGNAHTAAQFNLVSQGEVLRLLSQLQESDHTSKKQDFQLIV
ncbi:MAG: bifunctional alpha,alpha-trehalose-phosphate synthase (UDP-forming)/trehalose-phosphatase [Bacteroidota bacterium]